MPRKSKEVAAEAKVIHADIQTDEDAVTAKSIGEIRSRIFRIDRLDVSELTPFQGKAKTLSEENFNKLRKSLIEEGFSFTVHVWENAGKRYLIDGHQRVHVLKQLRKEGYEVPKIECAFVDAKNYRQAKKLVMLAISQYGKLNREGFLDFVGDDDFDFGDFDFPDLPKDFFEPKDKEKKPRDEAKPDVDEFVIAIICESEGAQQEIFEELKERGYTCKII